MQQGISTIAAKIFIEIVVQNKMPGHLIYLDMKQFN